MNGFIGFPEWFHYIGPLVFGVAVFSVKLMADALADDIIEWLNRRFPHKRKDIKPWTTTSQYGSSNGNTATKMTPTGSEASTTRATTDTV